MNIFRLTRFLQMEAWVGVHCRLIKTVFLRMMYFFSLSTWNYSYCNNKQLWRSISSELFFVFLVRFSVRLLFSSLTCPYVLWLFIFSACSSPFIMYYQKRQRDNERKGRKIETVCRTKTLKSSVELRFNEVAKDRPNSFVKSRTRYIEVLFHIFFFYWCKEYRSLNRGFRKIEVC